MGFVVLHLLKPAGTDASMTAHIERTIMPANTDPTRTHLNQMLIEYPDGIANRTEAIQQRLDTAGFTRKIGKNQRTAFNVMLSGTPEDMKRIETDGKLDEWSDDNLKWLCKTYGSKNVVSAVLHLDEKTPHIHATVVPIVTTERKKKKSELEAKKRYRTKSRTAARLCLDDVMKREKLKEYQTTYAEAMAKYGLHRGIDGSEARHISTQQWYRDLSAQNESLKESIGELKTQEQQAQQELGRVKSELSREKFKNTAAEVGSNLIEGIGSVIGTSKVKKQQQEIENLKADNQDLKQKIIGLNQAISRECKDNERTIGELKAEHATITDKLLQELKQIYDLFPHIRELLKIENLCKYLGFTDELIKMILEKKPVGFKGKIYSSEHKRDFETDYSVAEVKDSTTEPGKLDLTIDGVSETSWFRQKHNEFLKSIGINIQPKQDRGMKR